jgi:ParB-like nuclease domain.
LVFAPLRAYIGLVSIESIRPHELFLEDHVREVMEDIRKSGVVRRPLIVDASTLTLLDGVHRLEALRRLGALLAPVIAVDYSQVEVEGWAREYELSLDALSAIKRLAPVSVRERADGSVIVTLEGLESYYDIRDFEAEGFRLRRAAASPRSLRGLIVVPPRPTRELVLKVAGSGNLLPPKSTRHKTVAKKVVAPAGLTLLRGPTPGFMTILRAGRPET